METVTEKSKHNFNKTAPITMRKKGSPHLVLIAVDPEDPHFSNVELRKVLTDAIAARHYILTSDANQWVGMYEKDGFHRVEVKKEEVTHD